MRVSVVDNSFYPHRFFIAEPPLNRITSALHQHVHSSYYDYCFILFKKIVVVQQGKLVHTGTKDPGCVLQSLVRSFRKG